MTDDENQHPIIDGPPPSNWQPVIDAWRALVAALRSLATVKPRRIKAPDGPPTPATGDPREAALERKTWEKVHGRPMLWMSPFFLAFAAAFAAPHLAAWQSPADPRATLHAWVGLLPDRAAPLADILAGWLWLPWWVGLPALALRLNAARITGRAIMDAVGWSMSALALEGAAWLYVGRKALAGAGVSAAERDGAWQLLVAELVFLFLVATVLGPDTPRPRYFNQNMR